MRYTRIVAAFVFSATLIFSLCLTSFAAPAATDSLYCSYGVAYFSPLNSSAGKWVDYDPVVSDNDTRFTFSNLPANLISGNYEYSFNSFSFLLTPNSSPVEFENGYVYSYEFQIRSTKNTNPNLTGFQFGVCTDGFNDAVPLADVVYTYDFSGSTTVNYYVTVTLNVDSSFPASSVPHPDEAYIYLLIGTEWSDTFSLIASKMSVTKSVGEGAYYQASIDAIENLPQTEYDYILSKMPDDQGYIDTISGDLTIMHNYFISHTDSIAYLYNYLDTARPCMYIPDVKVPFFKNLNIVEDQIFYFDTYLNQMNTDIMPKVNIVVIAIRIFLVMTFLTTSIWKMVRVEWWL